MPKLQPSKRRGHQATVASLQGQVERLKAELAAAEVPRCGPGNYGPCGEDVCDAMDRELAREKQERAAERATWLKAYDRVYGWLTRATAERAAAERRVVELEQERDTWQADAVERARDQWRLRESVAALEQRVAAAEAERDAEKQRADALYIGLDHLGRQVIAERPDGVVPWCEVCGDAVGISVSRDLEAARAALQQRGHSQFCPLSPVSGGIYKPPTGDGYEPGVCSCGLAAVLDRHPAAEVPA